LRCGCIVLCDLRVVILDAEELALIQAHLSAKCLTELLLKVRNEPRPALLFTDKIEKRLT
jgi:hypothetical protein